jgi:hypothetical protein
MLIFVTLSLSVAPGKRMVIGNYTYLDSDLHVKLSLAADAIIGGLCKARPDTGVAFLGEHSI